MAGPVRSRTPASYVGAGVLAFLLLALATLTLLRWWGPDQHLAVLLASGAPFALPAYAVLALVLGVVVLRSRRRVVPALALAVALAGTTLHAAWLAPAFVGQDTGQDTGEDAGVPVLTVATLNLQLGRADTDQVAAWLATSDADVVVLTETTPGALAALEADERVGSEGDGPWPRRAGVALPQAAGTVVLSAYPLARETPVPLGNRGYRMAVSAPGGSFTLTAAHTAYPLQALEPWRTDLRTLERDVAEVEGPHLVVGDLNATVDHRALRDVLAAGPGLRDAAEQAGSGWQPTWPAPGAETALGARSPLALLRLDHVLVSPGMVATSTATTQVDGTDHLALVVRLSSARTLARR